MTPVIDLFSGHAEQYRNARPGYPDTLFAYLSNRCNQHQCAWDAATGNGQAAKICNNMLLAIHMIGTCEALAMGERNGLDPAVLSQIMLASSGRNWSLEVYNPWGSYQPKPITAGEFLQYFDSLATNQVPKDKTES